MKNKLIIDFIKDEIKKSGKSNNQIISELGISRGKYYDIFRKGDMSIYDFLQLAEILSYSPEVLFKKVYQNDNSECVIRDKDLAYQSKIEDKKIINGKTETEYLREKIDQLIQIISELSKKIRTNEI